MYNHSRKTWRIQTLYDKVCNFRQSGNFFIDLLSSHEYFLLEEKEFPQIFVERSQNLKATGYESYKTTFTSFSGRLF